MSESTDRPPAFEVELTARAGEMIFHVVGEPGWHTEGSARAERVRRRDGLPSAAQPHVRYTNVRVSSRLRAWLAGTGTGPAQATPPGAAGAS